MRLARLLVLLATLSGVVVLAGASPAMACSCASSGSDADALAANDAAFVGTVVAIHDARQGALISSHPDVVVLDVAAIYAGEIGTQVGVVTNSSSGACGYEFEVGVEYVVFGRAETGFHTLEDGWFDVGLCSGTRPLADGPVMIDATPGDPIDTGRVSEDAIQRHLGSVRPSLFPEAFIFVGVIAFVVGLVAWLNRKGRTVT